MEELKRNLTEDLESLKQLNTLSLGIAGTQLQEIAGYWIPSFVELTRKLVKVDSWGGKYLINEAYRPIAEALVDKYEELSHIIPAVILFVDNISGSGSSLDKKKYAQISKIPGKWSEIIKQLTGRTFDYVMEFFKLNIYEMSQEQIIALIYHELRHIDRGGDLKHHDLEDWAEMLEKLGPNWATTKASIPDLLDEDVDWDSIQVRGLFPEAQLKLVK